MALKPRPQHSRRSLGKRLRRLGAGERLMVMAMLAILAGGFGLIGQGLWLKATDAALLHAAVHSSVGAQTADERFAYP